MRIVTLTPPQFTDDHIKEKITCIRAHRERLFYVGLQDTNHQLVVHNYGHGGAGWTFLFGCTQQALQLFAARVAENNELRDKPIAVVGAGCYGLLTAIMLRRQGYTVRIIAKDRNTIASHKAAGFFFPRHRKSSTLQERAVFESTGLSSYREYLSIIQGVHPFIKKGPKILPAYFGLDIDPGFAPYIQAGLMGAPEQVVIDFCNGKQYDAIEYHTLFINPSVMMQEFLREIEELQIPISLGEIRQWDDIDSPVIFNCAGLGVRELTKDPKIVPVQGHLISLKNQAPIEQLQYMINVKVVMTDDHGRKRDELIYFAPKGEGIVGITFKRGVDSLIENPYEFDRLLTRCRDFFGN